jgi:hypothetical protein
MNLSDIDHQIAAAAVAATGTVIAALIQLRAAWRKEVSERARGVPATKKSRRGPVLAIVLLLVAAGVGGFAFSQFLVGQSFRDSAALQGELQAQIASIRDSATRLERAVAGDRSASGAGAGTSRLDALREATVSASIGPCRPRTSPAYGNADDCGEQDANQVTLCASYPATAAVAETLLYARPEGDPRPWVEAAATPGQDIGKARFAEKAVERADTDTLRQVCTNFSAWDGQRSYAARMMVRFSDRRAAPPASQAALAEVPGAAK